jgi:glycine/D-amino acid oxidase-like deaminating enzyme
VHRKSLFWFETSAPQYDVANGFPVFLYELPKGVFYGFPKLDARGVKAAEHSGGRVVDDPLVVDRSIDANEQQRLIQFLSAHLPGVTNKVTDHVVCLYTMSPDENFIVDRHPAHANVVFAAGLSGHGFKFVPVLGRALAELALDGGTKLPIGFLSLARLS